MSALRFLRVLEKAPSRAHFNTGTIALRSSPRRALHASARIASVAAARVHTQQRRDADYPHSPTSEASGEIEVGVSTDHPSIRGLADHLSSLFGGLEFPPELARRVLTHSSHRDARNGHNGRMSFIGRRAMEAYMNMFLHSLPQHSTLDYTDITERILNTYALGEHIAPAWKLVEVMRWMPVQTTRETDPLFANSGRQNHVGFYKVTGTTVEAVVGGVFHQHGANAANILFHTRILPNLPRLSDHMREHVNSACTRIGGPNAPLVPRPTSHGQVSAPSAKSKMGQTAPPTSAPRYERTVGAPTVEKDGERVKMASR